MGQPACRVMGWSPPEGCGQEQKDELCRSISRVPASGSGPACRDTLSPSEFHFSPCVTTMLPFSVTPSELLGQDLSLAAHRPPGRPPPAPDLQKHPQNTNSDVPSDLGAPALSPPHNWHVPRPCQCVPLGSLLNSCVNWMQWVAVGIPGEHGLRTLEPPAIACDSEKLMGSHTLGFGETSPKLPGCPGCWLGAGTTSGGWTHAEGNIPTTGQSCETKPASSTRD